MSASPPPAEPASGPAADAVERLTWPPILRWGVPIFGLALPLFFVQVYFLNFATDVLLMAPGVVGGLFAVGRLWDAVTDPAVGYWSDRTNTRLGRRRPWMIAGLPLFLLFFFMLFVPPAGLGHWGLRLWIGVALFGFYTAYTVYAIPHHSLGAELSLDHHDRSRVFGLRHVVFTLGVIVSFAALSEVQNAPDPRASAARTVEGMLLLCALLLALPPLTLRERPEHRGRGARNPRRAARDVWSNPHARILLVVLFIEALGGGVLGVLAPFIAKYVLLRPEQVALLPGFFVGASVLSVPFWVALSRRHGKTRVWLVAMVGTALSFGATVFAGEGDVALIAVLLTTAGISSGCGGAMSQSVLADIMDYDEVQSGERKEGAYSAAAGFAFKAAQGCTVAMTGIALQLADFRPNVEQSPAALWTIKLLFAGAPFAAYLVGAWLFRRFRLDAAEHARLRALLDARKRAARERAGG